MGQGGLMIGYTATETFNSSMDKNWQTYINGFNLNIGHLKEIVSLDDGLCPTVIGLPVEKDREYRVPVDDYLYDLFSDLEYMITRIQTDQEFQILAAIHKPDLEEVYSFKDERFIFKGYDLMEDGTQTSALTNCGGDFDLAYKGEDLSESGLIEDYEKIVQINKLLLEHYPNDNHADCEIWALWKMKDEYLPQVKKISGSRHIVKTIPFNIYKNKLLD
jgi:hypothetical protein